MTPVEFKAWFEGFTEAFTGTPTKEQWKRIKARVAEIDGKTVTERVFVDRYWPHIYPYYGYHNGYPWIYATTGVAGSAILNQAQCMNTLNDGHVVTVGENQFLSVSAMHSLGQAEAASLNGTTP